MVLQVIFGRLKKIIYSIAIIYTAILSYYYYAPIEETPLGKNFSLLHFLSSMIFPFLLFELPESSFLIVFLLEFMQIFIPYRFFDFWDLFSNFLGAGLGVLLIRNPPVHH